MLEKENSQAFIVCEQELIGSYPGLANLPGQQSA
jgi:hypothetical protein